jgi:hypothetical protein
MRRMVAHSLSCDAETPEFHDASGLAVIRQPAAFAAYPPEASWISATILAIRLVTFVIQDNGKIRSSSRPSKG